MQKLTFFGNYKKIAKLFGHVNKVKHFCDTVSFIKNKFTFCLHLHINFFCRQCVSEKTSLPSADSGIQLGELVDVVSALLDIPVHK